MKNPNAVALGSKGGFASAKKLNAFERNTRAIVAVNSRELRRRFARIVSLHEKYENGEKVYEYETHRGNRVEIAKLAKILGMKDKDAAIILRCSIGRVNVLRMYNGDKLPKDTREFIIKREGGRCKRCGIQWDNFLQVHHIGESSNHSPENLIAVCIPCHIKLDKERRIKNGTWPKGRKRKVINTLP